uniref:Uncharacterized protein n=1 Tax=Scleropages formosus TaxID=113540 RepID=A0A8C9WSL2_SCLFO
TTPRGSLAAPGQTEEGREGRRQRPLTRRRKRSKKENEAQFREHCGKTLCPLALSLLCVLALSELQPILPVMRNRSGYSQMHKVLLNVLKQCCVNYLFHCVFLSGSGVFVIDEAKRMASCPYSIGKAHGGVACPGCHFHITANSPHVLQL